MPSASGPRFTISRGCSWRPWKKRTAPVSRSLSSFLMTRSRYGCPGHETSIIALSSRITAWKMRSPFRVGITPFEMTVPSTVTSIPGSALAIGAIVLASS